ncbi:MAG: PEP-utilizing enzyme, partial [Symbiobacteriaceae bacterium]|nr:PEP-utilizing enzyme [Symbiobacteriaceae bacterium]
EDNIAGADRGDIFVLKDFQPSWGPRLAYAGGLIIEPADPDKLLSTMGRIFGVPALMGVANASTVLQTGMEVKLEATKGLITIIALPARKGTGEDEANDLLLSMLPFAVASSQENGGTTRS